MFAVGDAIVKLYVPRFAHLAPAELATARRLRGQVPVATPEVIASGTIGDWPYVVMSRLPGQPLKAVRPNLAADDQQRLVADAARLLTAVHAVPTTDLPELDADWPTFVRERIAGCVARHTEQQAPAHLVAELPEFLANAMPLYPDDLRLSIVTGDFHDYHLLVEERGGRWQLSGLFDFDDARLGHVDYDLAAAALFLGSPTRLLDAYGADTDPKRLLAYTLLHRYRELRWVLREYVGHTPSTLDELAHDIYGADRDALR